MIKQIIKNIFSKKIKTQNTIPQPISGNSITFFIDLEKDSEPNVKIVITDTSNEACKKFSELLFDLHSGEYHKSTLDLLLNMGKQDDEIKKFAQTTILFWSYLLKTNNIVGYDKKSKPLIMPTDFNKNAK